MNCLKLILDFIAAISWQITVVAIVCYFRKSIKTFFDKANRIALPGGFSVEIDKEILEVKALSKEIKNERKPEVQKEIDEVTSTNENEANKRMIELGLIPSPSGLNLDYYRNLIDTDPRLALIGLRVDLETMLKNLAKGFKIEITGKTATSKIVLKLAEKGAITSRQNQFILKLLSICNSAAHGAMITKSQALEVLNVGEILVKEYLAWLNWGFK